jgi:hypothetical protein
MKTVTITANTEYVMGHLRYGHYEGTLELSEEEYELFRANPVKFMNEYDHDLDFIVDDWRVEDIGAIDEVTIIDE